MRTGCWYGNATQLACQGVPQKDRACALSGHLDAGLAHINLGTVGGQQPVDAVRENLGVDEAELVIGNASKRALDMIGI